MWLLEQLPESKKVLSLTPTSFHVKFGCSLWLPPTVQIYEVSGVRLIGASKLTIGMSVSGCVSLCASPATVCTLLG